MTSDDSPNSRHAEEAAPAAVSKHAPDIAAAVDAAVALHGLAVEPAWREAATANLAAVAAAARLVAEFPLDDELEPAPVFSA